MLLKIALGVMCIYVFWKQVTLPQVRRIAANAKRPKVGYAGLVLNHLMFAALLVLTLVPYPAMLAVGALCGAFGVGSVILGVRHPDRWPGQPEHRLPRVEADPT